MTDKGQIICVNIGRSTWQGPTSDMHDVARYFLERDEENGHRIVRKYSVLLNGEYIGDDSVSACFPKGVSYDDAQDAFNNFMSGRCQ